MPQPLPLGMLRPCPDTTALRGHECWRKDVQCHEGPWGSWCSPGGQSMGGLADRNRLLCKVLGTPGFSSHLQDVGGPWRKGCAVS